MTVNLNVEHFIGDIFDRPTIWNGSIGNKDVLWGEISDIHGLPIHMLKTKWENLRRSFRNQLKKIPRNVDSAYLISPFDWQTPWPYYRLMLFLVFQTRLVTPYQTVPVNIDSSPAIPETGGRKRANVDSSEDNTGTKIRRTNSDVSLPSTVEFNDDAVMEPIVSLGKDEDKVEIKKSPSMVTTLNWGDNRDSRRSCDSDRFYLKSLLHYFTKLDYTRKLEVREKIDRLLIDAVGKKRSDA